ncbi:MAG TPA: glycosyltransferase [Patescibacteria group bacterium]|nr:glycosyltransferase [Patescibacteria group bacterium]
MLSDPDGQPPVAGDPLDGATILLDCRWLGRGGAGRLTEMLLDELAEARPGGVWRLWGEAARLAPHVFPGASVAPWSGHPMKWFGQEDLLRVPANDVAVYLHQVRPLRPGLSITFVLDTIPLRFGGRRWVRWAKGLFFRIACRLSARVITISAWSRESIIRDLHVPRRRLVVTSLAVDPARVGRMRALRASSPRGDHVLYVGRFADHKNLPRLCRAFQSTTFRRDGGHLVLVGGAPREVAGLSRLVARERLDGVDVRGECTEADLDLLLATCRALVQPAMEEGYGLPAVEAAAVGVQVAVTRAGVAPQIPEALASFMDALDESSIASAIDEAVGRGDSDVYWPPRSTLAADLLTILRDALARDDPTSGRGRLSRD